MPGIANEPVISRCGGKEERVEETAHSREKEREKEEEKESLAEVKAT